MKNLWRKFVPVTIEIVRFTILAEANYNEVGVYKGIPLICKPLSQYLLTWCKFHAIKNGEKLVVLNQISKGIMSR